MVAHCDLVKVFRALMEEGVPQEIRAFFVFRSAVSQRDKRATDRGRLNLRRPKLTATQRGFSYRAAAAWNRLPPGACDGATVHTFKTMLTKMAVTDDH